MPERLYSARLVLERLGPEHFDLFASLWGDAETARFIGGQRDPAGAWTFLAIFAGQWALYGFGHYAIAERNGRYLGFAGLWFPVDWPEIEIGYGLLPDARGIGYAREAVQTVRDAAFVAGAPGLVSYIAPQNLPSQRVAQSVGAVHEATIALRGLPAMVMRHATPGAGSRASNLSEGAVA
nr:GNAT family N-acetyltransferase [Acuticoccus mangrovi]